MIKDKKNQLSRICFGTSNISTLMEKYMEKIDSITKSKINFMCLQEIKWVDDKAKELDSLGFKNWYTNKLRSRNEVDIIVDTK